MNKIVWTKISRRGWSMSCWIGKRADGVTFRLDRLTRDHGARVRITLIDERGGRLPLEFSTLPEAKAAAEAMA